MLRRRALVVSGVAASSLVTACGGGGGRFFRFADRIESHQSKAAGQQNTAKRCDSPRYCRPSAES